MGSAMKFSSSQAQNLSGTFKTQGKKFNTVKKDLDKNINEVMAYWKGESQDEFKKQYTKFAPSLEELQKLTESISKQLDQVVSIKEKTERSIMNMFK